jgi:hypothetical protein
MINVGSKAAALGMTPFHCSMSFLRTADMAPIPRTRLLTRLSHQTPIVWNSLPLATMDNHETSTALFGKLYAIKELGPGHKPVHLDKARVALREWVEHGDACIREQARGALKCFETWFSVRKWNRDKDRGSSAECTLVDAISKLCDAIDSLGHGKDSGQTTVSSQVASNDVSDGSRRSDEEVPARIVSLPSGR